MEYQNLNITEESLTMATTGREPRLFFVDHLRVALIILVVLHHLAISYGAGAPFYYVEPAMHEPPAFLALLVFTLFNQAWFMGALFFLTGYFAPGSYDRKGPRSFLWDRLVRLGIPLLVFYFVLSPLSSIGYWHMPSTLTGITTPLTWGAYPYLLGLGPMWFVAMLLIFDFGYVGWRLLTRSRRADSAGTFSAPGYFFMGVFIPALALASYLMRMAVPLGKEVLDFPSLAYLPQYVSFFALGIIVFRRDWFKALPGSRGWAGLATAVAAAVFLFPLAISGHLFSLEVTPEITKAFGNGHWRSAVYALWDSSFAVGMCLAAVTLFRHFFKGQKTFGRFLSEQSYGVFVLHAPIIVFVAVCLKTVHMEQLLKFGLAAVVAVPTCFAAVYLIRKIPGVSRVL